MPKGNKIRSQNRREKGIKIADPPQSQSLSTGRECPVFCLQYIQKSHCLSDCTQKEKAHFADKLHKLSQLPWNRIISSGRHGLGCEEINRNSIRSGIPSHITEDETFLAFRFSGQAPMIGYRRGNVFHIVWIDRNFKLYNHGS